MTFDLVVACLGFFGQAVYFMCLYFNDAKYTLTKNKMSFLTETYHHFLDYFPHLNFLDIKIRNFGEIGRHSGTGERVVFFVASNSMQ